MKRDCTCESCRGENARYMCFACTHQRATDTYTCKRCVLVGDPPSPTYPGAIFGTELEISLTGYLLLGGAMLSDWAVSQGGLEWKCTEKLLREMPMHTLLTLPCIKREVTRFVTSYWEDFSALRAYGCTPKQFLVELHRKPKEVIA